MFAKLKEKARGYQTMFSFGSTSAIITNLGLIAGLHSEVHAKLSMISGILVIALADNISDSFGIHIFQESENIQTRDVWISTFTNFMTRVIVSLTFIALILFLPLKTAVISSIIWGLLLIAAISYCIAVDREKNPFGSVATHLFISIVVLVLSNLVGDLLVGRL